MESIPTAQLRKPLQSNFELFRIFLMLMIIAHHYVVNSGVIETMRTETTISFNFIWAALYGWGGKTGIDCFLLITGYFMCKQEFSWRKFFKLILEIKFYKFLFFFLFAAFDYEPFTLKGCYKAVFNITIGMGKGFTSTYVCLYLLTPYINIMIKGCDKRIFGQLLLILLGIHTVLSTFILNGYLGILSWYVTVYLIGAYIRLYPKEWMNNKVKVVNYSLATTLITFASIIVLALVCMHHNKNISKMYILANPENHILAILPAILYFLLFRNLNIGTNKGINAIATTIFGVFLIHANSNAMRRFLWRDFFDNAGAYATSSFWLHSIVVVLVVFFVSMCIDFLRIWLLERPLFAWWDKHHHNF